MSTLTRGVTQIVTIYNNRTLGDPQRCASQLAFSSRNESPVGEPENRRFFRFRALSWWSPFADPYHPNSWPICALNRSREADVGVSVSGFRVATNPAMCLSGMHMEARQGA
jgi:hypothetical protein